MPLLFLAAVDRNSEEEKQFTWDRSVNCSVADEDFDVLSNTTKYENKLIHEHDFVQLTSKGVDNFLICCITCGSYYCNMCGKKLF
jgi:hypothetical protein